MDKEALLLLYDYNYWANARILSAAAKVQPAQFIAQARLSHGSLRGTLVHILSAEIIWRLRCAEGMSPAARPQEDEFPTLAILQARWREEERAMRAYLAGLNEEHVRETIRYTTTKGVPHENVLWHLLAHLVNHGTQFRSEAGVGLTEYGHSPGDVDMVAFFRERGM